MPRTLWKALAATVLLGAVAGCDAVTNGEFEEELILSAVLEVGEEMPTVQLTRLVPIFERYDPEDAGVQNASITITELDAGGAAVAADAYISTLSPGLYVPATPGRRVLPDTRYRIEIDGPEGQRLTAETRTPPDFDVLEGPAESLVYQTGQGPESRITLTSTEERRARFILSVEATDALLFERVVIDGEERFRSAPLDQGSLPVPIVILFGDCEFEPEGTLLCDINPYDDARSGSSPILNEDSYIDLGDGTAIVQAPWLAFGFYGPHRLTITSIDEAINDLVATQAIQFQPTTLSPGEIPNVTTNVEGGLGVFGSIAREVVVTTILER